MQIKKTYIFKFVIFTFGWYLTGALFLRDGIYRYLDAETPAFAPGIKAAAIAFFFGILFSSAGMGIIWGRLYGKSRNRLLLIYILLCVSAMGWALLFLLCRFYFISALWLLGLIFLYSVLIYLILKKWRAGAYMQAPYYIWWLFLLFLSFRMWVGT